MGHYVLLLLTLNIRTGEVSSYEIASRVYHSAEECLRNAIARGPQAAHDDKVQWYSCRDDRSEVSI